MLKVGTKEEIRTFLRLKRPNYYVYVLYYPNGDPFYVGKGTKNRVFEHEKEVSKKYTYNPYKINTIKKIYRDGGKVGYGIDSIYEKEQDALDREYVLVEEIGRPPLTNLCAGGGVSDPKAKEHHFNTLCGKTANKERSIVNKVFTELAPVHSVPIKPLSQFRVEHLVPNPHEHGYTPRPAAALFASAVFNGIMIKEGSILPRQMNIQGIDCIIENGVGGNILKAEWAKLVYNKDPAEEKLKLTKSGVQAIQRYIRELPKDVLEKYT